MQLLIYDLDTGGLIQYKDAVSPRKEFSLWR